MRASEVRCTHSRKLVMSQRFRLGIRRVGVECTVRIQCERLMRTGGFPVQSSHLRDRPV